MPALADRTPTDGGVMQSDNDQLNVWAEAIAKQAAQLPPLEDAMPPPGPEGVDRHRQPPRSPLPRHAGLKSIIAASVFAISLIFGTSLFLFQSRPDLLASRATMMVMQSVIAFIVVILLALTLFRLMALDRQPARRPVQGDLGPLAGTIGDIGDTMDMLAERSVALEERLAVLSRQLEWNARKNVAALQNAAAGVEQQLAAFEQSGATANDVLARLAETARQLNLLAATLNEDVWSAANRTHLTLDAGTRYMADRLSATTSAPWSTTPSPTSKPAPARRSTTAREEANRGANPRRAPMRLRVSRRLTQVAA